MEKVMDALDIALQERLDIIYFNLCKEDEEVGDAVEKVKKISAKIKDNQSVSQELREQIEDYIDYYHRINGEIQKAVYKEAVKDCIKLLKTLGILT